MIEHVVALIMFVGAEIKEHRIQKKYGCMPSWKAPRGETV